MSVMYDADSVSAWWPRWRAHDRLFHFEPNNASTRFVPSHTGSPINWKTNARTPPSHLSADSPGDTVPACLKIKRVEVKQHVYTCGEIENFLGPWCWDGKNIHMCDRNNVCEEGSGGPLCVCVGGGMQKIYIYHLISPCHIMCVS